MSRRAETLLIAGCLAVFLLFASAWIHLPGPQHDELLHLPVVFPALRSSALYSVQAGGHPIPLMIMSYNGALKGWLLWLWFLVVPTGVPGYRALGVLLGLVTLWLIYRFVRRWWGPPASLLTLALVATDPSFVQTIRLDYGPVALMHFLKMGGLCLLSGWHATGSRTALAGGAFLFGLGLWDKANFIWFLAGLGAALLALFPLEMIRRWKALPVAALALAAGAAPFLAFNLVKPAQTWVERGRLEVRWSKLLQAQGTLNGDFMSVLTGESELDSSPAAHDVALPAVAGWMYQAGRLRQTIILPLLALAVVLLPANLKIGGRKALLFPLLMSLFTYAAMFFTFDGGSSVHHVIMLQPFPLLFVAVSLWAGVERRSGWVTRRIALAVVAAAVAVNLSLNARHLAVYTRTGGSGGFSDAVYRLAAYLARSPETKLFALDWGFSNPVLFLTGRPVDDVFFLVNAPDDPKHPKEVAYLAELMRDPNNLFLLHSPQRTLFPAPAAAFYSLVDGGVPMRQVAFFEERSGEMVFEVYRLGEAAPRGLAPEVEVRFTPDRVRRSQTYQIQVREFAGSWIDVVYHVNRTSSGSTTGFCRLDGEGRATLTVPATHPVATVRITLIRPRGGEWRPARGSITVTE